jgi:hypothetical protein
MKKYFSLFLVPIILAGCAGEPAEDDVEINKHEPALKIVSPENDQQFTIGDIMEIQFSIPDKTKATDIEIFIDDTLYQGGGSLVADE